MLMYVESRAIGCGAYASSGRCTLESVPLCLSRIRRVDGHLTSRDQRLFTSSRLSRKKAASCSPSFPLCSTPVRELIGALTYVAPDALWKNLAELLRVLMQGRGVVSGGT